MTFHVCRLTGHEHPTRSTWQRASCADLLSVSTCANDLWLSLAFFLEHWQQQRLNLLAKRIPSAVRRWNSSIIGHPSSWLYGPCTIAQTSARVTKVVKFPLLTAAAVVADVATTQDDMTAWHGGGRVCHRPSSLFYFYLFKFKIEKYTYFKTKEQSGGGCMITSVTRPWNFEYWNYKRDVGWRFLQPYHNEQSLTQIMYCMYW